LYGYASIPYFLSLPPYFLLLLCFSLAKNPNAVTVGSTQVYKILISDLQKLILILMQNQLLFSTLDVLMDN
jgi:hypothetical protein